MQVWTICMVYSCNNLRLTSAIDRKCSCVSAVSSVSASNVWKVARKDMGQYNTIQYSTQHNTINLLTPLGHNWEDLWTLKEILWHGWVTRNCKVICIIVFLLWLSMHSCMASSFGCSHVYGMYAITGNSLLRYDIRPDKHLYIHSHTYFLCTYAWPVTYQENTPKRLTVPMQSIVKELIHDVVKPVQDSLCGSYL